MFAAAGSGQQFPFLYAISLACAEFGAPPWRGNYGTSYYFPTDNEWDWAASRRFNCVRLPVRWERCQATLGGALDATYMGRIDAAIAKAKERGMRTILDIHNYGGYYNAGDAVNEHMIGGGTCTEAHFVDLWTKLAQRYINDQQAVIFGLMNEPRGSGEGITTETWFAAANAATAAIRAEGWKGLLMVCGNGYSGVAGWTETTPTWYGTSNADYAGNYVDSANNYLFEGHSYWDTDGSGDYSEAPAGGVANGTIGTTKITGWINWLRTNKKRGFVGEWGVPSGTNCQAAVEDFMRTVWANRDVVCGLCWWAAGPWWGATGGIIMQPTGTGPWTDVAQYAWWRDYMPKPQP